MELPSRTPLVVEFNGLSGTGKTTTAKELGMILTNHGIKCVINFEKKTLNQSRFANWISPSCWRLRSLLNKYIATFDNSAERYSRNNKFLLFFRQYRDFHNSGHGVFLKDQGLIQILLSIAYLDIISKTDPIDGIASFLDREISFLRVDCVTDTGITCNRLLQRSHAGSRLQEIAPEKLTEAMRVQAENLEKIRFSFDKLALNNIQVIRIDMRESAEINAKKIFQAIQALQCQPRAVIESQIK